MTDHILPHNHGEHLNTKLLIDNIAKTEDFQIVADLFKVLGVVKLTTDNFEQEVLQAQQPVLVDFYADWCGPCKMMAPIVEALSEELSDVKVCHINIDENIDIAQKYRVMSIPTFIAFKGGEESGRQIGAIPKTALVDLVK